MLVGVSIIKFQFNKLARKIQDTFLSDILGCFSSSEKGRKQIRVLHSQETKEQKVFTRNHMNLLVMVSCDCEQTIYDD